MTATEKGQAVEDDMQMGGVLVSDVTYQWSSAGAIGAGITLGPAGGRKFLSCQARTEPSTGGFRVGSSDWPNEYGGQCAFTLIEVDETTRSVRGEFSCAELTAVEATEPSPCAIGPSYYYFETARPSKARLWRLRRHARVAHMEGHAALRGLWTFLVVLGVSQACKSRPDAPPKPKGSAPASCTVDGLAFPDGAQQIPDSDGCNECRCKAGELRCTAVACSPESGCRIGGKVYAEGANDVPDPKSCNCCACEDGKLARCGQNDCASPATCRFQGFEYAHGRGFGTDLFGCRCEAGRWHCGADRKLTPRPQLALRQCPTATGVSGPDGATLATSKESLRPSMFRLAPDIDQQGLFEDLFMIWNMKKSLPPQANARRWFAEIPKVSRKPPRTLEDGVEELEATAGAKYASCSWALRLSEPRLRGLTIECAFQRWRALEPAFRQALGPAFEIRASGDRAVARVEYKG